MAGLQGCAAGTLQSDGSDGDGGDCEDDGKEADSINDEDMDTQSADGMLYGAVEEADQRHAEDMRKMAIEEMRHELVETESIKVQVKRMLVYLKVPNSLTVSVSPVATCKNGWVSDMFFSRLIVMVGR